MVDAMRSFLFVLIFVLAFAGHSPVRAADAPGAERLVKLEPIVLPTIRKGKPDRQVTIVILLELVEGQPRATVIDRMPRLRDAYITELMGLLDYDWPGGSILDVEFARKRLMMQSARVLGEKVVDRLLFDAIRERRV